MDGRERVTPPAGHGLLGVAGRSGPHYLGLTMMRLPRPASPRALWKDIKDFAGQRSRHQWIAAVLALAIPTVILVTFAYDREDAHKAPPQIIYVESWPASRTMDETRAYIRANEERRKAFEEERRRQFQRLDNTLNKIGI